MFNEQQISDFKVYEKIRLSNVWNMFDKKAIQASSLSRESYFFVMNNYSELRKQNEN